MKRTSRAVTVTNVGYAVVDTSGRDGKRADCAETAAVAETVDEN